MHWESNLIGVLVWLTVLFEDRVVNFGAVVDLDLNEVCVLLTALEEAINTFKHR